MAGLGEMFQRLIGGAPEQLVPPAEPLSSYPTPEDAAYARKYDFGYGTGNEPYIQGNVARVVGEQRGPNFVPGTVRGMSTGEATSTAGSDEASRNLDLKTPDTYPIHDTLGTQLAQAALAANRSPMATLGFDPSRAAIDVRIQNPTVAGAYAPKTDNMYIAAGAKDPSTIVHESMHRGIRQLRENPELRGLFDRLPSEELIVRYLMATQAGDPEKGGGTIDQQQRDSALKLMPHYGTSMERLNRAAEDAYARRRPGGPR
jgi:hypothetical protein